MKLSDYARKVGVSYRTAWNWYRAGKLRGYQMDTGTIIVEHPSEQPIAQRQDVAIYARVNDAENRPHLDSQVERLLTYCAARGYQVSAVVKEIGSGVNEKRPRLMTLLCDPEVAVIVVENQDRLARFGFHYIEALLTQQGRRIEVVNLSKDGHEELLADLTAIIHSFCTRLYGVRRAKRKIERISAELQVDD